jgi:hypothetical protein
LNQVDKLSKGLEIKVEKKAQQEVLNYIYVLYNLSNYIENGVITEKSILEIHQNITHYTLDDTIMEDQFRIIPVYVKNNLGKLYSLHLHHIKCRGILKI